jgi:hypothetical protein
MKRMMTLILTTTSLWLFGADTSVIVWPRYVPEKTKQECYKDPKLNAKMAAINKLRQREAKSIKSAKYSQKQMRKLLDKFQPDGSHSDFTPEKILARNIKLGRHNPKRQTMESTIACAYRRLGPMLRTWYHTGKDPKIRKKLQHSILYYLKLEWSRHNMPPHNKWVAQCMLAPALAAETYFTFFDDMSAVENGKTTDAELLELNRMIKLIAPQCFSEQQRKDAPNPLSVERFQHSGAWCGGNFGYRPLLKAALVCSNPKMIDIVVEVCKNALEPVSWNTRNTAFWVENITWDGGGWGHGRQAYIHGYPLDGMRAVTGTLCKLAGTIFLAEIDTDELMRAVRFSEGNLWYCYGIKTNGYTLMAPGRISMRCGKFSSSRSAMVLARNVMKMLPADAAKERKYTQKIIDVWNRKIPEITGTRYFWNCESMIHRRSDYYVGVNMVSMRKYSTEVCNTSTSHTEFLCDGSTFIMKRPDEYNLVKGFWDFSAIPGTTVRKCIQKANYENWGGFPGLYNFAGGVTDGTQGVAGFIYGKKKLKSFRKLDIYGVKAYKSYFFFDDALVCLGAGIINEGSLNPVRTCLNQAQFRGGKVEYSANGGKTKSTASGPFSLQGKGKDLMAVHDGVGYIVLAKQTAGSKVGISLEQRKALWMKINARDNEKIRNKPEKMHVFQMMIDHGSTPQNGSSSYGYIIGLRCNSLVDLVKLKNEGGIEVLSNTNKLQAVRRGNTVMAIFYKPGTLKVGKNSWICDVPAVLMFREQPKGKLDIYVSDPCQQPNLDGVRLTTTRKIAGRGCAKNSDGSFRLGIPFPASPLCGKQTMITVSTK